MRRDRDLSDDDGGCLKDSSEHQGIRCSIPRTRTKSAKCTGLKYTRCGEELLTREYALTKCVGLPLLEHVGCAVTELPRTEMPADTFYSGGRGLGGQCYWNGSQ